MNSATALRRFGTRGAGCLAVIDVRLEAEPEPWAGRCGFCFQRVPSQMVHGVMYEDGEPLNALACAECLALDDAALRARMREAAGGLASMAENLRAAASGPIQRPAAGVLELERLHRLPAPVVIDRIG